MSSLVRHIGIIRCRTSKSTLRYRRFKFKLARIQMAQVGGHGHGLSRSRLRPSRRAVADRRTLSAATAATGGPTGRLRRRPSRSLNLPGMTGRRPRGGGLAPGAGATMTALRVSPRLQPSRFRVDHLPLRPGRRSGSITRSSKFSSYSETDSESDLCPVPKIDRSRLRSKIGITVMSDRQ
jgi:hypothetical protein